MKMLYIANIRLPTEKAYGIQIMKMCEAFSRIRRQVNADIDVTLVVPTRRNTQFAHTDPFVYYGVERSFTIKRINIFDPWWLMRLPQGIYIKTQAFCFIVKLFLEFYFQKKYETDAIAYTRDEYLLPLLHKFFPRVVWEAHTLPSHPKRYIRSWRKCRHIIAITKGLKDALVKQGVYPELIMVAPDGVDIAKFQIPNSKFQIRQELGLPQDKKIILYSGHLYEWKGVQTLADAARLLDDRFLIVFVGGTSRDIKRFADRNKSALHIKILGYQPHYLIPHYLNAADALVLPNSAERDDARLYTSPMKLFEYMTAHTPLIASRVPALQEILNDRNAIFFKPDDPRDLANVIQKVIGNSDIYDAYWKQANKDVMQYAWLTRVQRIFTSIINEQYAQ